MKILVIGGMHGNEPLGIDLVSKLRAEPIGGVDTLLANERAVNQRLRFTEQDLNRCFPGDEAAASYEARRAALVLAVCEGYDVVLDFHNTHCPDNDCSFVGDSAVDSLYAVSASLGLSRVIVADYDCLNKYASNCISVEVSLSSPLMNVQLWYSRISALATTTQIPKTLPISYYRFVYRLTLDDRDRLQLDARHLQAFKPIDPKLAKQLNVNHPAYPIFINDAYTPYNYGGIINKM